MLDDTEKRSSARRYEPQAIMRGHRLRRVISHFEVSEDRFMLRFEHEMFGAAPSPRAPQQ
jgi:hypothetical protein